MFLHNVHAIFGMEQEDIDSNSCVLIKSTQIRMASIKGKSVLASLNKLIHSVSARGYALKLVGSLLMIDMDRP